MEITPCRLTNSDGITMRSWRTTHTVTSIWISINKLAGSLDIFFLFVHASMGSSIVACFCFSMVHFLKGASRGIDLWQLLRMATKV
ncbi:hypothetical protein ACSBR2_042057 [Camellia fascicularis]